MKVGKNIFRISYLITRYQRNVLSEEEKAELEEWINSVPSRKDLFYRLNDELFLQQKYKQDSGINSDLAYHLFLRRTSSKRRVVGKVIWTSVAAVIAVFLCIYWLLSVEQNKDYGSTNGFVEVMFPAGENKAVLTLEDGKEMLLGDSLKATIEQGQDVVAEVVSEGLVYTKERNKTTKVGNHVLRVPRNGEFTLVLSDGTKIWLNSDSKVCYPTRFVGKERKIRLEGEAYLQVAYDENKPFVVELANVKIGVLGTSFNVRAYHDEDVVQTTLVEGRVYMATDKQNVILAPNEQGCVDVDGCLSKRQVDVRLYTGWKEGRFIFEGQTLEEIMRTLSRWYDLQIVFDTEVAKYINFTGNLKRYDDFDQILSMLELACSAKFVVKDKTVHISK